MIAEIHNYIFHEKNNFTSIATYCIASDGIVQFGAEIN